MVRNCKARWSSDKPHLWMRSFLSSVHVTVVREDRAAMELCWILVYIYKSPRHAAATYRILCLFYSIMFLSENRAWSCRNPALTFNIQKGCGLMLTAETMEEDAGALGSIMLKVIVLVSKLSGSLLHIVMMNHSQGDRRKGDITMHIKW